jgi:hypothetical protein
MRERNIKFRRSPLIANDKLSLHFLHGRVADVRPLGPRGVTGESAPGRVARRILLRPHRPRRVLIRSDPGSRIDVAIAVSLDSRAVEILPRGNAHRTPARTHHRSTIVRSYRTVKHPRKPQHHGQPAALSTSPALRPSENQAVRGARERGCDPWVCGLLIACC